MIEIEKLKILIRHDLVRKIERNPNYEESGRPGIFFTCKKPLDEYLNPEKNMSHDDPLGPVIERLWDASIKHFPEIMKEYI